MVKLLAASIVGLGLAGGAYYMHAGHCPLGHSPLSQSSSGDCQLCSAGALVVLADATASATQSAAIDVKNTKCIVTGEDAGAKTVEYKGKLYHICCPDCVDAFNKNPQKYVKALEADPAKFGVKK